MRFHLVSSFTYQATLAFSLLASLTPCLTSGVEPPYGLSKRVPWTASHLRGSPEPPLPYTVEKIFTKVTWKAPLYLADEPGTNSLWVTLHAVAPGQGSRIVKIQDNPEADQVETVLDFPNRIVYSICFHPDYKTNGYVYFFTNGPREKPEKHNQIVRYTVDRTGPCKIDPKSETTIIEWASGGHDGGDMLFGLDGMFYITTGDGTSDSDAWVSGQTLDDLLGSVLRIDLSKAERDKPYAIPPDNPFISYPGARPEIWAYGLRNPWRMGMNKKSGHIWVGTNGQDQWETAHLIGKGENYGWSVYEGSHPFYLERKRGPTPLVLPTIEHSHAEFRSLTGGVVYHGEKYPELEGVYLYGDYSSGRIWGMLHDGTQPIWHKELADTSLMIASFRVDHHGDLLIVDNGGGIYRLVASDLSKPAPPFPTLLSQTGLFTSTRDHVVDKALIPYSVNAPGWADGATAERFIAVPGEEKVAFNANRGWTFPDGTALVQTLALPTGTKAKNGPTRVETRVLLKEQGEWAGYSYRWNPAQTDATLVPKGGEDLVLDEKPSHSGKHVKQNWRIPSRTECMTCHSRAVGFVLGVSGAQLNRDQDYHGVRDNQLRALDHIGFFSNKLPKAPKELPKLVDPKDPSQNLEARARAYLEVNCSVCHVEAGGGNAKIQLAFTTPLDKMSLIDARPQHDTFGINNAMLVAPGEPKRSVLLHRLSTRGRGQMPPLVTNQVDTEAVEVIQAWIAQLKPTHTFVKAWEMSDFAEELRDWKPEIRSIEAGRTAFREVGCVQCHRVEGEGGSVGPDLAGLVDRHKPEEVLESILLPSKSIADEYAGSILEVEDGTILEGRIDREDEGEVVLRPYTGEAPVTLKKNAILQRKKSDLSNMPNGTVNVLKKEQVLDLLGFLLSKPIPPESPVR